MSTDTETDTPTETRRTAARGERSQLRKDLSKITLDGGFYSVMVGFGELYIPAFILALGHGQVASGLVSTLPLLAGAVLQLVTPHGVRWFNSHRTWVSLCAAIQAASLVPLLIAAMIGSMPLLAAFAAVTFYWAGWARRRRGAPGSAGWFRR